MANATFRTRDNESFAADAVCVLGPHPTAPAGRATHTVNRNDLEQLRTLANTLWPAISAPLIQHVLDDARRSDLWLGERPEEWSPLGSVAFGSVGRLRANYDLHRKNAGGIGPTLLNLQAPGQGSPLMEVTFEDQTIAAFGFAADAWVFGVSPQASELEVRFGPEDPYDQALVARLQSVLPGESVDELVFWRLYTGRSSWYRDAITQAVDGVHRLTLTGLSGSGVLVARVVKTIARLTQHTRGDTFAKSRLSGAELKRPAVAKACPDISKVNDQTATAVIVVHGTMATGVDLASVVERAADNRPIRILRFEHDTWLPISVNAAALVAHIQQLVTSRVFIVAHSRGGLVARHARDVLRRRAPSLKVELLTLGSPFKGTPVAATAKAAHLGIRVLEGGLRLAGGPVVDAVTRLSGFFLRPNEVPPGIREMEVHSPYIMEERFESPSTGIEAFGGVVDEDGARAYGVSFREGFSNELFEGARHDLVVSLESACWNVERSETVSSDHFSYPESGQVLDRIRAALASIASYEPPSSEDLVRW